MKKNFLVLALFFLWIIYPYPSFAIEPVKLSLGDNALDLTNATDIYSNQGEDFQVYTAADIDGMIRRIEVRSSSIDHRGDWAVFALANMSDNQLERLIVVPHFRLVGSKLFWPDLGRRRIISITPSEGFSLDRLPSHDSDVFRITINPGAIVTFVVELAVPSLPQIYLWEPDFYKDTVNSFTLYKGIVLGISGLIAVFLTVLFMVNNACMIVAAATIAWVVFVYICIDFGFISKLMNLSPGGGQIWRACAEISLSSSLIIFLFTYLKLNRWHANLAYITFGWIISLVILFSVSFYHPSVAAGIARISFCGTVLSGILLIIYLVIKGCDRAVMLIPAWTLIVVWLIVAWMAISKLVDNDIVQPALGGGLVLVVILIGLMVMRHVMASSPNQDLFSDMGRQSLAVFGSGDIVWDWDVVKDEITTIPDISSTLGFASNFMHGSIRNWLRHVHSDDRDCFRAIFDGFLEHRRGVLRHEFRMRAQDRKFNWMVIKARPVLNVNGEIMRCVGTVSDITEQKNAIDGLLYDSFKDNLTGLPNRQSFLDRLTTILSISLHYDNLRPNVMVIDIDKYKHINNTLGVSISDNIILALSKRIAGLLRPQDILARVSENQFGIILVSESDSVRILDFTTTIIKSIITPIHLLNREIVMTTSIGLAGWTNSRITSLEMLKYAEIAMYRAKNMGVNRIERFQSSFRSLDTAQSQIKEDLRHAIDNSALYLVYQPVIRLMDEEIMGFEAILRWDHPKFGDIPSSEFISIAEESDMIGSLNLFMLERISVDIINWRDNIDRMPFFISINIFSDSLINNELYDYIRAFIAKTLCSPSSIRLELSESIVVNNPEKSRFLLDRLQRIGVGLTLDDFGTKLSLASYINKIPFDSIKVNRSLITGSAEKRISTLHLIASIARNLELNIIANDIYGGKMSVRALAKIGYHFGQFSNLVYPMRSNSVLKLLKERLPLVKK
ncbi:MAG: sensor domain-containing phosphodiesterase [Candidatus Liberibacter europaeus]|nr:sensor domain-containing phosphodiesterase [Candidatus Liberibacter europaeus]